MCLGFQIWKKLSTAKLIGLGFVEWRFLFIDWSFAGTKKRTQKILLLVVIKTMGKYQDEGYKPSNDFCTRMISISSLNLLKSSDSCNRWWMFSEQSNSRYAALPYSIQWLLRQWFPNLLHFVITVLMQFCAFRIHLHPRKQGKGNKMPKIA